MAHARSDAEKVAILEAACEWVAEGKPLREFCRVEGNPPYSRLYEWMRGNEEMAARFARARDDGADVIAQECLEIADDASNDWMERAGKDGEIGYCFNGEHVQRSKLRVETRLKLLAKWNPKKYGDKLDVTTDGKPLPAAQVVTIGGQQVTF